MHRRRGLSAGVFIQIVVLRSLDLLNSVVNQVSCQFERHCRSIVLFRARAVTAFAIIYILKKLPFRLYKFPPLPSELGNFIMIARTRAQYSFSNIAG